MKPRNVSVSVREQNGMLKAFNISFDINGKLPTIDGIVDDKARKSLQKRLAKFIESIEFFEL